MELAILNKKLAMDSRDIAKIPEKTYKIAIIYNKEEIAFFHGNKKLEVFDDTLCEGSFVLEDSRRTVRDTGVKHELFIEALSIFCNCKELETVDFVAIEYHLATMILCCLLVKKIEDTSGYVYVFYDKISSYTKIGRTQNIEERIKALSCANPCVAVYGYLKSSNMYKLETLLHRKLEAKQVNGEWYNISKEVAFDALKSFEKDFSVDNSSLFCVGGI